MDSIPEKRAPLVVRWLNIYAIGLAVYLSASLFLVVTLSRDLPASAPERTRIMNFVYVLLLIALSVGCAAMPFLPRRKWAWVYGLALIAVGLVLGIGIMITIPVSLALLWFWIRPETREYFAGDLGTGDASGPA